MTSPLENLCGPGKPLRKEPPDAKEFAGLTCRTVQVSAQAPTFTIVTQPNPIQQRALKLLDTITV